MTITALVVLMTALAAEKTEPARPSVPAPEGQSAAAPRPATRRPGVTCTLRVVHAPADLDAAMVVRLPVRPRDPIDPIVRDSVSPCAE